MLVGCAAVTIDPEVSGSVTSRLSENNVENGIHVPLLSLENILFENNVPPHSRPVLKMDCEGCEYDVILSSTEHTLQKFSHILIEYHYSYKDLLDVLIKSGFRTSISVPRRSIADTRMRFGYIFADRI